MKRSETYVQFEISGNTYNGCSKGLKEKFVGRHRMLRKFISPRHWLTCKHPAWIGSTTQSLGCVLSFGSTNNSIGTLPPDLFLSNSARIDLFPQLPIERSVPNFFLSLKVSESELRTMTAGETWHRFFR